MAFGNTLRAMQREQEYSKSHNFQWRDRKVRYLCHFGRSRMIAIHMTMAVAIERLRKTKSSRRPSAQGIWSRSWHQSGEIAHLRASARFSPVLGAA